MCTGIQRGWPPAARQNDRVLWSCVRRPGAALQLWNQMGCPCSKDTKMDDIKVPRIDENRCGPDIKQGVNNRISGSGTALCNTNVLQDRMYFEVKIINPDGVILTCTLSYPTAD